MLLNNFFKISKQQQECDHTVFTIELIVNHPLYAGHFPERPIVPGVCSIEIIKNALLRFCKVRLNLLHSNNQNSFIQLNL